MSKSILIVLLVVLLAGGGVVLAEFGPDVGFAGVNAESVDNNEEGNNDKGSDVSAAVHVYLSGPEINLTPGDEGFGPAVADRAKDPDTDLGKEVSEAARKANGSYNDNENGENDEAEVKDEDERSDVAKAVHKALTADPENGDNNGLKPGEEGFGEAVSKNAREGGAAHGQRVSEAARGINGSNGNGNGNGNGN